MMHYDMGSTHFPLLLRSVDHHWTPFQTCSLVYSPPPTLLISSGGSLKHTRLASGRLLECCLISTVLQYNANLIQSSPQTGSQRCSHCRTVAKAYSVKFKQVSPVFTVSNYPDTYYMKLFTVFYLYLLFFLYCLRVLHLQSLILYSSLILKRSYAENLI